MSGAGPGDYVGCAKCGIYHPATKLDGCEFELPPAGAVGGSYVFDRYGRVRRVGEADWAGMERRWLLGVGPGPLRQAINFGMMYGLGEHKLRELLEQTNKTRRKENPCPRNNKLRLNRERREKRGIERAVSLMSTYHRMFPGVPPVIIRSTKALAEMYRKDFGGGD